MLSLDVHDQEFWLPVVQNPVAHEALLDWMLEHRIIPILTTRLEIHVMDCGVVRFTCWRVDNEGKPVTRWTPDGLELVDEIREVVLRSDPPVTFREE